MSPQRVAAAAATAASTVSPYPFDARQERHGQASSTTMTTAAAVENGNGNGAERNGNGPHVKGKKTKKSRAEREARREEEIRFNIGPRNIRSLPVARGAGAGAGRRVFRMPGRMYPEDHNGIPDYPPPSFQEAMTTPPVSVCSSTTSLPLAPATTVPLHIPANIPEESHQRMDEPLVPSTAENPPSDNDLDFEGTMFVIDRNSIPVCSTDLPRGVALEERVKIDWLKRRGVEFPGKGGSGDTSALLLNKSTDKVNNVPASASRGRPLMKQLAPLLIDPDPKDDKRELPSPVNSSKRRFLSLSPLRTIFPPRSPTQQERATLSAHPSPSPSPYHTSRSLFFRSSTSLATASILKLPLLSPPSSGKSDNFSLKVFKGMGGKSQRNTGMNDPWEVVDEDEYAGVDEDGKEKPEHPRSLLSAIESIQSSSAAGETSPTRSQSFTFGTQAVGLSRAKRPLVVPDSASEGRASRTHQQENLLRDWKGPSSAFIDRPLSRSRSPTPISGVSENLANGSHSIKSARHSPIPGPMSASMSGPPLTTVRVRPTFPASSSTPSLKHTAQVTHPSPLRVDAIMANQSAAEANIYQRALDTPLPVTPVVDDRFDNSGMVDLEENIDIGATASISGRSLPKKLTNTITATHDNTHKPFSASSASLTILTTHPSATLAAPTSVANADSLEEPMTPTRHHYAGRPLPRPPANANASRLAVVDSMYASPESPINLSGEKIGSSYNNCPEGLLIDLDDTTLDTIPGSGASTPRSDEATFNSQAHPPPAPMSQASSSSVDLLIDHPSFTSSSIQRTSTPLLSTSSDPSHPAPPNNVFSEFTELDLLVSRLTDDRRDGADYETLLLVSELIGPATSTTSNNTSNNNPSGRPTDNTSPQANKPNDNISLIGRIEVSRRRVTKQGIVKLKLTLLDVAVNKCGICLFQFRDQERAALTSVCQHSFHEKCVERWLARSKTCPLCRIPLDTDFW